MDPRPLAGRGFNLKGTMHKLTLIDRLRGWHYIGAMKVRNWCGCIIR